MKKIFLNGRFLTQPITGVQRVAFELAKAIDDLIEAGNINKDEFEFTLIYSGSVINAVELKHIKLLKKGSFSGNLWEQLELPFYTAGHLLISMCSVSSLLKRKQVVVVHDASFAVNPQFFSFPFRIWYQFAIRCLGLMVRQIITVSEFSRTELVKHAGISPGKISVMHNSADHILRYADPTPQFKAKIEALKPYCLAVSSLGANKNFEGLSQAIAKADLSSHKMLIAGGAAKTLKTNYPSNENIHYLGYVSDEELKYLYSNADLFVFPSFYEGFGIPPLEAMLLGCPVLASNTSSLPEVLGNACAYCNPSDINDIANKIENLIKSPVHRSTLRDKGFKQATKYDWHGSAKRLVEIIIKFGC